ncbi:hypothetical protein A2482_03965 [Candidatus Falkowbacteria bacterium RIFOXYC2_FULL_48_21]|uniref:Uncharacterized protein n=1 Tax=Candidatus Falkowbacteria bacterium RIFOXYC2_FULL_48_21 TaxID=1798005 RepID=A0A1F5THH2_9BACT|nr:MAG: hypothetical protein A2482_03965 [Candidatus Falkowbacteria bacterium RIFOXYC2_FULL_48_21]
MIDFIFQTRYSAALRFFDKEAKMLEELTQKFCLPAWFAFVCACGTIYGTAVVTWLWLTLLRNIDLWNIITLQKLKRFCYRVVFCDSVLDSERDVLMKFLDSSHMNKSGTARRCNLELFVMKAARWKEQALILVLLDDARERFLVNLNDRGEFGVFIDDLYLFLDKCGQARKR